MSNLEITKLSLTAGFDVEQADTAQIFASLTYTRVGDDCPALPIDVEIDGTPLATSPNGTGKVGAACQLGYYIDMPTADGAAGSTVTFRDSTGEASLAVESLLAPHALVSGTQPDSTLQVGNQLLFEWSVESDKLDSADAYFKQPPTAIKGEAKVAANNVQVTVPDLTPGDWAVRLGAIAAGNVTVCKHAAECSATTTGNGLLAFKIQ